MADDCTTYTMAGVKNLDPLKDNFGRKADYVSSILGADTLKVSKDMREGLIQAADALTMSGKAEVPRSYRNFSQMIDALPPGQAAKALDPQVLSAVRQLNDGSRNGTLTVTPDVERTVDSAGPGSKKVEVCKPGG